MKISSTNSLLGIAEKKSAQSVVGCDYIFVDFRRPRMEFFSNIQSKWFKVAYWVLRTYSASVGAFLIFACVLSAVSPGELRLFRGPLFFTTILMLTLCFLMVIPHRHFIRAHLFALKFYTMLALIIYILYRLLTRMVPMVQQNAKYGTAAVVSVIVVIIVLFTSSVAGLFTLYLRNRVESMQQILHNKDNS